MPIHRENALALILLRTKKLSPVAAMLACGAASLVLGVVF